MASSEPLCLQGLGFVPAIEDLGSSCVLLFQKSIAVDVGFWRFSWLIFCFQLSRMEVQKVEGMRDLTWQYCESGRGEGRCIESRYQTDFSWECYIYMPCK